MGYIALNSVHAGLIYYHGFEELIVIIMFASAAASKFYQQV
jgi:hypothetical protein